MFKRRWMILSAILVYLARGLPASGAQVKQVLTATDLQVGYLGADIASGQLIYGVSTGAMK